ncbi:MAG: hypothetical protein HRU09_04040 [Oligoflexales bacterium]|nr:hypothetical protein [Oligoflexales bacterium]
MSKGIIDSIEIVHNRLSDTNFVWFPFLWLKLSPSQQLTPWHLVKMTFWFGLYFNVAYLVKKLIFGETIEIIHVFEGQLAFMALFYIWFNLVTKTFWNRRAKRINQGTKP